MRTTLVSWLLIVLLLPGSAAGWGFDVHRFITDRAIDHLPAAIRPFYQKHRAFVVEHSIDPDLWRNAGWLEEPPRHFLDIDAYGPYPYTSLPRDFDAAVKKYGRDMVIKNGLLPWRTAEIYEKLQGAFERQKRGQGSYTLEDIQFFSAVVAHYVGDAHVPFHAVVNYDGQLTNQHGIHSRFETELVLRYREKLAIKPPALAPVRAPRDYVFESLVSGARVVDAVLAADRRAVAGREYYDDTYFARFLEGTRPIVERRLSESVAAIAAVITGAWEAGGRPDLPLDPRRRPSRVRRP
jgi:hypothetical protein